MSKRYGLLLGATALFAVGLTVGSPDMARAQNTAEEICDRYVSYGYFDNKGKCMQRLKKGPVNYCKYLKERGYFKRANARWKNQGDCVSWYRKRGN